VDGPLIVVDVKVKPDDLKPYQAYMKRLPINRPPKRVTQLTVALSLTIYALFVIGLLSFGWDSWGTWLVMISYLAQLKVCPLMMRFNQNAVASTFDGRLTIESSGLTMERPGSTSRFMPSALVDVASTDEHLFVCFGLGRGWILPRRCFKSGEDFATAASMLREMRQKPIAVSGSTA
jgi:hypothetical protein